MSDEKAAAPQSALYLAIDGGRAAADSAHLPEVAGINPAGPPARPCPYPSSAVDRVAAVVWAAHGVLLRWDAAGVLGLATRRSDEVPLLLAAIEQLREALAQGDS